MKRPNPAHHVQELIQTNLPSITAVAPAAARPSGTETPLRSLLARRTRPIINAAKLNQSKYRGSAMNVRPAAPSTEARAGTHAGQVSVGNNENPNAGTTPMTVRDFM